MPEFQYSLLSASKLAKQLSIDVVFSPTMCYLQDHLKNKPQVLGKEKGGLYLVGPSSNETGSAYLGSIAGFSLPELWHCKLGHPTS